MMSRRAVRKRLFSKDGVLPKVTKCEVKLSRISDTLLRNKDDTSEKRNNNTSSRISKYVLRSESSSHVSETELSEEANKNDSSTCWENIIYKYKTPLLEHNGAEHSTDKVFLQQKEDTAAYSDNVEPERHSFSKNGFQDCQKNKSNQDLNGHECIQTNNSGKPQNSIQYRNTSISFSPKSGSVECDGYISINCGTGDNSQHASSNKNNSLEDPLKTQKVENQTNKNITSETINKSFKSKNTNYSKKKEFCTFCEKLRTNIARHFELCHHNEEKVAQFLTLEKKSDERAKLITQLRNEGNFKFNIKNPDKPILVRRRYVYDYPENPRKYFLPCPSCQAYFSYKHLSKHYESCSKIPTRRGTVRCIRRDARLLATNIHPIANSIMKMKILPPMRDDKIFQVVKNDRLILLFGNHLTPKYIAHQEYIIRQRLRLLARYLIIAKQICPEVKKLENIFHPRHFETAIKSVCQLAELSTTTGAFLKPKLALEMMQYLKVCSKILESNYIKEGKDTKRKNVNKFYKLLESESASRINKPAHRDLIASTRQNKIRKQGNLPLSDDITKFKIFLLERANNLYQNLIAGPFSYVLWKQLAELTLLYIVVYNRKRSGEAQRILVQDFLNIHPLTSSAIPEELDTLDESDKEKAEITYKLVIRGKLDRTICAFVPENVKHFLDYVFQHRAEAKVPNDNPYLFGLPGKLSGKRHKTLETCFLMRKYTPMANLQNPHHFRSTLLRKHLATKVSTLNLQDAQQETVHDFMGHHGNIHKGFYRQRIIAKDLMMNKILNQDVNTDTLPNTSASNNSNKNKNLHIEKKNNEIAKTPNRQRLRVTSAMESSVDSENDELYARNLAIIQTTPARTKKIRRNKHKLKTTNTYSFDEPDDPFAGSNSDDPSIKSADFDTEDSSLEEENDYKSKEIRRRKEVKGIAGVVEKPIQRQRWNTPQKKIMFSLFKNYIQKGIYPSGSQIQKAINTYPELAHRTVAGTKSFLQHEIKKRCLGGNY